MYANIVYEVHCYNERLCKNRGIYPHYVDRGPITDEEGKIVARDFDIDYIPCRFCTTSKSSIYNEGTVGYFDDLITDYDYEITINMNNKTFKTISTINHMHGRKIAIFKKEKEKKSVYDQSECFIYKFYKSGRCLGKYIFFFDGTKKHKIEFTDLNYLYFDAYNFPEEEEEENYKVQYTIDLNISL